MSFVFTKVLGCIWKSLCDWNAAWPPKSVPEQPRETLASGRSEQITLKTSYDCLRVSGTWLLGDKVEL